MSLWTNLLKTIRSRADDPANEQARNRFSPEVLKMLRKAGWFPGRDISDNLELPPGFQPFPAALRVLREFGLLQIGHKGSGVRRARCPGVLDPMLLIGE